MCFKPSRNIISNQVNRQCMQCINEFARVFCVASKGNKYRYRMNISNKIKHQIMKNK